MHCQNEELLHDRFDELPDSIVNLIFNSVSDVKSLIRCRAVSKRFNSLVPQAESLVLKVDRVDTPVEPDSFIVSLLKSLFQSLQGLISHRPSSVRVQPSQNSPARILRVFEKIKSLEIELPCGDLELEKGSTIRWSAVYGKTLKSCVILGSRSMKYPKCDQNTAEVFDSSNGSEEQRNGDGEIGVGLKTRVVWTISTLIAASARHHMLKEVIDEHKEMEMLVVKDRDGEGVVVMDKEGLRECRENGVTNCGTCKNGADKYRTTVPDVTIKMKHEPWLEIGGGARVEGAALVVVTPVGELEADGGSLPIDAFDAMYGNVAKSKARQLPRFIRLEPASRRPRAGEKGGGLVESRPRGRRPRGHRWGRRPRLASFTGWPRAGLASPRLEAGSRRGEAGRGGSVYFFLFFFKKLRK